MRVIEFVRTRPPSVLLPALALILGATPAAPVHGQVIDPTVQEEAGAIGATVDSVAVEGNKWVSTNLIVGTADIPIGTPIDFRDIQAAERRLWQTGRFEDIQVAVRGGSTPDDPVVLLFRVQERPAVRDVHLEGLRSLNSREVRDSLEFVPGQSYSPQRVVDAKRYIRSELAAKGIPFADVTERLEPVPDGDGQVDLVLQVTEGHRVSVADVLFHGNDAFSDSELKGVLSTREEGFFWFRSGEFRQGNLEDDLTFSLPDFYSSNGYLDFQVLSDTLIIDPTSGKARLEVSVEEGPQYRLAGFSVEGSRQFPAEELEQYYQEERGGLLGAFGLRRGSEELDGRVFDQSAFFDAAAAVEGRYRNQGYLYAQVEPVIEKNPEPDAAGNRTVSVRWRIQEGQPAYVNRVMIQGNTYTHDRVIREQIAVLPGDVYSEERVIRSYQAISGLGFFESPLPLPDIRPNEETGDVDIIFTVEEQQTGSINFGTTMGGRYGVAGFIGYEQPNLFGQAKSGSLRWDFGTYQNNFHIQYTDPALLESRVSGSISLFDSRDRFFRFDTGERKRRGGLLRFGLPVPGARYTRMHVGYSLSRTDFRLRSGAEDESLFGRPPGTQSQVSAGITRRTLNHPTFPTVGSLLSLENQFNGGFLGGDGTFSKHEVRGEWWVPVGQLGGGGPGQRPIMMSLGVTGTVGTLFGDADRFPFDRFWMGGVQFGQGLRGYDETTITPDGYFGRGSPQVREIDRLGDTFMRIGAEYAIRLHENVSFSAFYEAGNVWRSPREMDPSHLFRGAGIGAMLVTPFGPIGIDYAYGFDKTNPGWQFHFRMGGQGLSF